jgi:von Willebrand factor type D domain
MTLRRVLTLALFGAMAGGLVGVPLDLGHAARAAAGGTAGVGATDYRPITPTRVFDTAAGIGTSAGSLRAGRTRNVAVGGVGDIPATGVGAVVVNIDTQQAFATTNVTVWEAGLSAPTTPTIVARVGIKERTMAVVPLSADGLVSVRSASARVQVALDVVGWFPANDGLTTVTAARLADLSLTAASTFDVDAFGHAGLPAGANGTAILNVAVTNATAETAITLWSSSLARPSVATIEARAGASERNLAFVRLVDGDRLSVHNRSGSARVTIDVLAWLGDDTGFESIDPHTPLDTAAGVGAPHSKLAAGASVSVPVAGLAGVPNTGVRAVVANLTVRNPTVATDLTVWPTGLVRPTLASLRTASGQIEQNLVVVPLGANGEISVHNLSGRAHVRLDLVGWFPDELPGTWRFVPDSITLPNEGATSVAQLTKFSDDGSVVSTSPPAGVTSSIIGDATAVSMVDLGDGRVQVTATDTVGSVLAAYSIPGQDAPASLAVMNARLRAGVVDVATSEIFFPPVGLPDEVDPLNAGLPGISPGGIGPFSVTEVSARASLESPGTDPDFDARIPWVLQRSAPPTDALVLGAGGTNLYGRVVEPDGLPTIEREGYSLITVELVPIPDIYAEVDWEFENQDFVDAGLLPGEPELETTGAAEPGAALARGFGRGFVAAPSRPLQTPPAGELCAPQLEASFAELKITAPVPNVRLILDPKIKVDRFGNETISVRMGYSFAMEGGISGSIQFAGTLKGECKLAELLRLNLPATFLGPAAPLVDVFTKLDLMLEYNITVKGGPRAEIGVKCTAQHEFSFGFQYTTGAGFETLPINNVGPTAGCEGIARSTGLTENAASIEAKLWVYGKVPVGLKFGGRVMGAVGAAFGYPSAGDFEIGNFKVGPRARIAWDSDRQVLLAKDTGAFAGLEMAAEAELEAPVLEKIARAITGGLLGFPSIAVEIPAVPLAALYRAVEPGPDPLVVRVNGVDKASGADDTVTVALGDSLQVIAPIKPKNVPNAPTPSVTGGSAWKSNGTTVSEFPYLAPTASATQLFAVTSIDEGLCQSLGDDGMDVHLLANAPMFDVFATSGYAGGFKLKCEDPSIEWVPTDLKLGVDSGSLSEVAHLFPKHTFGASWELVDDPAWPEWLDANHTEGEFSIEDAPFPITFTANCSKVTPRRVVNYTVQARTVDPDIDPELSADLPIEADCRPVYIEFAPKQIEGTGHSTLKTFGKSTGVWKFTPASMSGAPAWLRVGGTSGGAIAVSPLEGVYGNGNHTEQVGFTVKSRSSKCSAQSARSYTLEVVGEYRSGPEEDRTPPNATIKVIQPAVPADASKCNGATAYESGDPHVLTFDGRAFDAQTVGEYVLFEPLPGADGPTLRVRHQFTNPDSVAFAPTSVTAAALLTEGHLIEVYERPAPLVRVDGVEVNLEDGVTLSVTEDLSITPAGSAVSIEGLEAQLLIYRHGSYLDVHPRLAVGTGVRGLLGTPDGNIANDLVGRDGTTYDVSALHLHATGFYAFSDSWRVTNLADSLFTQPYDGFDDPNPVYNLAGLEPFRQQVIDHLGNIAAVCDTGAGLSDYVINALALELAIGQPLGDLSRYTCQYEVSGTVSAGGADQGVAGVEVTVDATGLAQCVTISGARGDYRCVLRPDLTEVTGPTSLAPLAVTVTARRPGSPTVVVSGSGAFDPLAGLNSFAQRMTVDLAVDPASLPSLVVDGTMIDNNGPVTARVPIRLDVYQSETLIATLYSEVQPDVGGHYSFTRVLPFGATRAGVVIQVGPPGDWITQPAEGLDVGPNAFTFDVDLRVPTIAVSGTMTGIGGAPLPYQVPVFVEAFDAGGARVLNTHRVVTPDPADGSYSVTLNLPRLAVRARLRAQLGIVPSDHPVLDVDPLVKGVQVVDFDVDYQPATLNLSGSITGFGGVPPTFLSVEIRAVGAGDTSLRHYSRFFTAAQFPTGAYQFDEILPLGTVRVEVKANPGITSMDDRRASLDNPTPGPNPLTFDIDHRPPRVTVSGTALLNSAPHNEAVILTVRQFDAADTMTQFSIGVNPLAGTYSKQVTFSHNAVRAEVDAYFFSRSSNKVTVTVGDLVPDGLGTATADLDVVEFAVTVHGTIRSLGVPVEGNGLASMIFVGFDENNEVTAVGNHSLLTEAGGSYSVTRTWPLNTTSVFAQAQVSSDGETVDVGKSFPVVFGELNEFTFDVDTMIVDVSGFATKDGNPIPIEDLGGNEYLDMSLAWPFEGGGFAATPAREVDSYDDLTGEYSVRFAVGATDQARVCTEELAFSKCSPLVNTEAGIQNLTFDFDTGIATPTEFVTLRGTINDAGVPWTGTEVSVRVTLTRFDGAEYGVAPPYETLEVRHYAVPVVDGLWTIGMLIPANTTIISARVDPDGNALWTRSFARVMVAPDPEEYVLDGDIANDEFQLVGTQLLVQPCLPITVVRSVRLWAFDSDTHPDFDFDTNTWPGGTFLGTFLFVPDPVTGEIEVSVELPPGTEAVGFVNDTPDLYPVGVFNSGYLTAYDVTPGVSSIFGFADEWGCPPT